MQTFNQKCKFKDFLNVTVQISKDEKAGTISEVLDLTHDQHSAFKLEFDDHEWKNHIKSLKPLGKVTTIVSR